MLRLMNRSSAQSVWHSGHWLGWLAAGTAGPLRHIDRRQHRLGRPGDGAADGRRQSRAQLKAARPDPDQNRFGTRAIKVASQGKHVGGTELMGERASGAGSPRRGGRRIGWWPGDGCQGLHGH